jgi:hypothetical protein
VGGAISGRAVVGGGASSSIVHERPMHAGVLTVLQQNGLPEREARTAANVDLEGGSQGPWVSNTQ